MRVCVIGAGAAGLCAARQLSAQPSAFSFDVFEQAAVVGGTWVYTEQTGIDSYGLPVHSSMYQNLRTNFLQEVMRFPDFPFAKAEGGSSYPHHEVVLQYLQDYATHFNLHKHIQFRTVVRTVAPTDTEQGTVWFVTVYNLHTKVEKVLEYDAVMVCNGHYSEPDIPHIKDIEMFVGSVQHSHEYRRPSSYAGQTVAVLGASSSGRDIALELATVADKVYLSHSLDPLPSSLPRNLIQKPGIVSASKNGFTLTNEEFICVDALLYCTGYKYNFPFLTQGCELYVRGRRVRPLYKHVVNIQRPTMGLIGIPFQVLPFLQFHCQIAFFLKLLVDPSCLPSTQEMYADEEREMHKRFGIGYPPRYAHKMGPLQWEYNDELCRIAGIPPLHSVYKEMYALNSERAKSFLTEYKNDCYTELFNNLIKS